MNWEFIISAAMVVVGGILSHQLASWRDRANKRREYSVGYLIEVFCYMRELSHHRQDDVLAAADEFDRIISDIQFLGNEEQIEAAKKLHAEMIAKHSGNLDDLMDALRRELRKELGRPAYQGRILRLKATKKSGRQRTRKVVRPKAGRAGQLFVAEFVCCRF